MGASVSKNVTKVVVDAITTTTNEVIQNAYVSGNQSIIIKITDTNGNVVIDNNTFTQVLHVDINALMNTLNNTTSSQKIDQQIAQTAKSLISGLNLVQIASTDNVLNSLIKTMIEVKNVTTQQCLSNNTQVINIAISKTQGNVQITNNAFQQLADTIQTCVQQAVNDNKTLQDIENVLNQSTVSDVQGLSVEFIAGIFIALAFTGVGGVFVGGKIIFPLTLLASVISFILYFQWTTKNIASYPLVAKTISESCSISSGSQEQAASAKHAEEKCKSLQTCTAYEWKSGPGTAMYYTDTIPNSCKSYYEGGFNKDTSNVLKNIVFLKGARNPSYSDVGNAWLNTEDGSFWTNLSDQSEGWNQQGTFEKRAGNSIDWGKGDPNLIKSYIDGDLWIDYNNPSLFKIYLFTVVGSQRTWTVVRTMKGIGPQVDSKAESSKTVGFEVTVKKSWLLILSIGLLVVGVIGLSFNKPQKR